jgi:hypothetical protein
MKKPRKQMCVIVCHLYIYKTADQDMIRRANIEVFNIKKRINSFAFVAMVQNGEDVWLINTRS